MGKSSGDPFTARLAIGLGLFLAGIPLQTGSSASESLGTISGTVFNAATKAPLAAGTVTLSAAGGHPIRTVRADRRGRYLFDNLPAGLYAVKASHPNFATGHYGQPAWNQVGRPIELVAGRGFTADIHLQRLGVITGTVVDENGEGIPNFPVNAVTAASKPRLGRASASGMTDDRGMFRVTGLIPGRYYVMTAARQLEDGTGLLATYYPGHLSMTEARTVTVEIGQETSDIQIQPIPGRLLRVTGVVSAPARVTRANATVHLMNDDDSRETTTGPEGQFAFSEVVPGRYTLVAEMTVGENRLASYQPLEIRSDTDGIVANLAASPEIRATLVDEKGSEIVDPQVLLFVSRMDESARTPPVRLDYQRTGGYIAKNLMPGGWRFFVICPETYAVDRILLGDRDGLGGFQLVPGRHTAATIRLTRRAGRVRGRVTGNNDQPAPGMPVLCYPLDEQNRLRLAGYRSQKTNPAGEYRFAGLPEGEYLIFATAVEDFDPDEQLETLKAAIAPLKVTASEDLTHDLRLVQ